MTDREYLRCEQVLEQVKGRPKEVLYAFAAGLYPQEVASKLGISKQTVDTHKGTLLMLCRNVWQTDQKLSYRFLFENFAWLINISDKETVEKECRNCEQVLEQVKGRPKEALYAFAAGLYPQEVASKLGISKKTVDTYKGTLLMLCRNVWNVHPSQPLNYHFIYLKFAKYFRR